MLKKRSKAKKLFVGLALLFALFSLLLMMAVFWLIRSTVLLPGKGGTVPGLTSTVRIEQDGLGTPTVLGNSLEDIYRGQGWITARDRLFQMDLLRRRSSGRLSEIFGAKARELDTFHRKLGFASVAAIAISKMPDRNRKLLEAYAEGVNAFIKQGPLPFEMRVLRYRPEPWRAEDTLLSVLAMFVDLDFASQYLSERSLSLLYQSRPKLLADFLTPYGGYLDTPVTPDLIDVSLNPPKPEVFDIRQDRRMKSPLGDYEKPRGGSNAWALSGKFTRSGKPILAGDPHLDLYAPNIWYRLRLEGGGLEVTGVSLPGVPGIVMGSNDDVAWSVTYPSADTLDLVPVRPSDVHHEHSERLLIKGASPEMVTVKTTPWGPVLTNRDGKDIVVQWTALDSDELAKLDTTATLLSRNSSEFLAALSKWKGPASNVVFASKGGDIGWALVGAIPERVGFDGRTSIGRDSKHYWKGYLPFAKLPRILNPPAGLIVSANQRMVPFETQKDPKVLNTANNLASPDRAFRIKTLLEQDKGNWTAESSYQIQLDIYSPNAVFYRDILLTAKGHASIGNEAWLDEICRIVGSWDGKVTVDSAPFPLLRIFRRQLIATLVEPLWRTPPLDEAWLKDDKSPTNEWYLVEPVVKALVEKKPTHLLPPPFGSYEEAIASAAVKAAKTLAQHPEDLKNLRWGDFNRTNIPHPFSLALPGFLGKYFRMPESEVPGALFTPRVASLLYGRFHSASMRMVIDLSDPQAGIFNQPGGQSGNFQSPHYSDQFSSWLTGTAQRFQPQKTVVVDVLQP